MKAGQIAHLDHDSSNNAEDNLAFLCFEHHDDFDSRTSQRKGLTLGEVRQFREELEAAIGKDFSVEVHFGSVSFPTSDPYAGQFVRIGGDDSGAELELTPIPDGPEQEPRYAITGFAMSGARRPYGPNIGDLAFIGSLRDNAIEWSEPKLHGEERHVVRLAFDGPKLLVDEENEFGLYGAGVTFAGEYRRREPES